MRTTIDLPDDLFRRVKSEAALRGTHLKDLIREALRLALEPQEQTKAQTPSLSAWDMMKDGGGIVDSGCSDLATNPEHMEGFGRGSMGHR
jgi:plasmid stability protein